MLRCMILSYVWCFVTWSSDGARCYPPLCKNHSLKHFACSHKKKKQFVRKVKRHGNKTLEVHTGTIDSCWGMLKKKKKKHTCPVDHLSSEPKRIEWIDLDICQNLAVALGDSTCWICSVEKNRQSLVQDEQVTVCECWNWGFGEKKLAARPIFKWEIW